MNPKKYSLFVVENPDLAGLILWETPVSSVHLSYVHHAAVEIIHWWVKRKLRFVVVRPLESLDITQKATYKGTGDIREIGDCHIFYHLVSDKHPLTRVTSLYGECFSPAGNDEECVAGSQNGKESIHEAILHLPNVHECSLEQIVIDAIVCRVSFWGPKNPSGRFEAETSIEAYRVGRPASSLTMALT